LKEHPGVEVISRDRGTEYIKGATDGAPDAIQVADRWHLLSNLKDALKRLLESKRTCLRAIAEGDKTESEETSDSNNPVQEEMISVNAEFHDETVENPLEPTTDKTVQKEQEVDKVGDKVDLEEQKDTSQKIHQKYTKLEQEKLARHERRQERYEEVRQLHQQGLSIRNIARRLKLSRITVRKYIEAETCSMYPEGVTRGSKLVFYVDYIQQRWESGCHNASQIWRELCQLGFDGSRGLVARWASKERVKLSSTDTQSSVPSDSSSLGFKAAPKSEVVPWSPSRAAWLLIK
jgi:DNA-binding NarL/FixJ family response regulator